MSILLDGDTRVIVQGITGREARIHVQYMRAYGTRVVAGVAPGKGGTPVDGIPVFDTVRAALEAEGGDASVLFVPGSRVFEAAVEAIDAGVRLVGILADGVPLHDSWRLLTFARRRGVKVVGPNSVGIISPGKAKIGGVGGTPEITAKLFRAGPVGVVSRSGGMGSEICWLLSRAGIGQSTYVSIGGDSMVGSGLRDILQAFDQDSDTHVVVIFGEPGTSYEEDAADFICSGNFTKPVVALVVGRVSDKLPRGVAFGHASALIERGVGSATHKIDALRRAGVVVAERMSDIPELVTMALDQTERQADGQRR
jgi:succinyl-CoA synthetase alpha subunit